MSNKVTSAKLHNNIIMGVHSHTCCHPSVRVSLYAILSLEGGRDINLWARNGPKNGIYSCIYIEMYGRDKQVLPIEMPQCHSGFIPKTRQDIPTHSTSVHCLFFFVLYMERVDCLSMSWSRLHGCIKWPWTTMVFTLCACCWRLSLTFHRLLIYVRTMCVCMYVYPAYNQVGVHQ